MEKKTQYTIAGGVAILAGLYFILKPKSLASADAPYGAGSGGSMSSNNNGSQSTQSTQGSQAHSAYLPKTVLTKDGARLRKSASVLSAIITKFTKNIPLTVTGSSYKIDGNWYQVKAPSGQTGWVRWDVVVKQDEEDPIMDAGSTVSTPLEEFEKMMGWGDY